MNAPQAPSQPIRVLLAEDQAMIRAALAALLDREPDITVVSAVDRGDAVLDAARETQADIALLDIEMPGMSGLEAAAQLAQHLRTCRPVILTTYGKPGYLRRAVESGAAGFILKDAPPHELADAIRRVMAGQTVIDNDLALEALASGLDPLTDRERDVLRACADGAEVVVVAERLGLSPGTVRNHISVAMQKLDAKNRFEAIRIAEERGWL